MDQEFFQFLASLGVGGILAGLLIYFYRADAKEWTERWQGQSEMLLQVVKENTAAITANTKIIELLRTDASETRELRLLLGRRETDKIVPPNG